MNQAALEFHQRLKAWFIQNPKMVFVIHAKPDPLDAERQRLSANAWFCYLSRAGLSGTASCWRAILNGEGKALTVPSERPEYFDMAYVPPAAEPHWNGSPVAARGTRGSIESIVDRTMRELSAAKPRGRVPTYERPQEQPLSPLDWLENESKNPRPVPVLSDEAIHRMNVERQRREADAA